MVQVIGKEELLEMDLEGQPVTEGFWLKSLNDAYELFRTNYIPLSVLDRIKDSYYDVVYNYPKDTKVSIALLRHKDGHWVIYKNIYL